MQNVFIISIKLAVIGFFSIVLSWPAYACTDIRIKAEDGTVVIGRSMEFGVPVNSNLRTEPKGTEYVAKAPGGRDGLKWTSKYGVVYLDGLGLDIAVDGMNERGLSFEALYLPGFSRYQTVPVAQSQNALPHLSMGQWILGNFASVDEVREALPKIYVYNEKLKDMAVPLPLHFAVTQPNGKGIVIEYTDGKLNIFENTVGVMTNSPTYDWQMTNLRNYVNLRVMNVQPIEIDSVMFAPTGQGSGLVGLPGDWTPPSRFVRAAVIVNFAKPGKDAAEAVNMAAHVMNSFDIPKGVIRGYTHDSVEYDVAEWVVIKDLNNRILHYRTYNNLTIRAVDLKKIDFSSGAKKLKMSIYGGTGIVDVTEQVNTSSE